MWSDIASALGGLMPFVPSSVTNKNYFVETPQCACSQTQYGLADFSALQGGEAQVHKPDQSAIPIFFRCPLLAE